MFEGSPILLPRGVGEVHHEVELGVVIGGGGGADVTEERAMDLVSGYLVALDLTARDLQAEAKKKGLPWTRSKCYDTFTPVSSVVPKSAVRDPYNIDIWLKLDGQVRQKGNTKDMVHRIPKLISFVSSIMKLEDGDLILTGTPAGVGPLKAGQIVTAGLGDLVALKFDINERAK